MLCCGSLYLKASLQSGYVGNHRLKREANNQKHLHLYLVFLYPLSGVSSTLRCPQGVLTHQLQPYDMANIVTVDTITVNCNITTKHLQTGTNLPWPLTRSHTDGDIDIRHSAVLTPAPGTAETTVLCSGYLRSLCADKPIINTDTFTTPVI